MRVVKLVGIIILFPIFCFAKINLIQTFSQANLQIESQYGNWIDNSGRLNNDSYDDICVYEILYTEPYNTHRINVYYGRSTIDNYVDVIIDYQGSDNFDFDSKGDLNGDGHSDIIVSSGNKLKIYQGGNNFDNTIDKEYTWWEDIEWVRYAGDLDNNGCDDLLIKLANETIDLLLGSSSMDINGNILGLNENWNWYNTVTGGDINGDGFDDIIYFWGIYKQYYYGSSPFDFVIDFELWYSKAGKERNVNIVVIGDINNNGNDDLILTISDQYYGPINYCFYKYALYDHDSHSEYSLFAQDVESHYFYTVAPAGDINNDGYDDFLRIKVTNKIEQIHVLLGQQTINYNDYDIGDEDYIISENNIQFQHKDAIHTAGDMNGDGYDDILVGTYLYLGGENFDTRYDINFSSQVNNNCFAYSGAALGDVNLDGADDFIISDFSYANNKGRSFLYADANKADNNPTQIFVGSKADYKEGISVAGAGDVNGDGCQDIIIGAEGAPKGEAKIIFGGDNFDENYDVLLEGQQTGSYFGQSVSSAGDFNGDGFDDVIVGAYKENNNRGKVYLYYGGSAMNNVPDLMFSGNASLTRFGFSLSTIGDINKDGYSDIIIGAPDEGKVYLYYGGASPDTHSDFIYSTGEVSFGSAIAGVGDVNGDTWPDILIGSVKYNLARGIAYLYYGRQTLENVPDVIFESDSDDLNFGVAVASTGDINADGYNDLIIGARGTNSFTGRAYLYMGSDQMDNTPDEIYEGEMEESFFGSLVTSVGDITKNGCDEFLIGAFLNGSGENGTAYLYGYQPEEDTLEYSFYSPGWYLLSIPLNLETSDVKSLFPGMIGDEIYIWDVESQQYIGSTDIIPGNGFWLPVAEAFTTSISGIPIYRYDYDFTTTGWHLVSSLFQTTVIAEPYDIPDNIVIPLYYTWDKSSNGYSITNTFHAQQANWVAVTETGKFILKKSGTLPPMAKAVENNQLDQFIAEYGQPPAAPDQTSDVESPLLQPLAFELYPNYPNPFNPTTNIKYSCAEPGQVDISIYNATGQKIKTMYQGFQQAGVYELQWNGTNDNHHKVTSGIYLIKLTTPNYIKIQKAILMK